MGDARKLGFRLAAFSETQKLRGMLRGPEHNSPGPLEHMLPQDFFVALAYSSQASTFTCRITLPSCTSSVAAHKTLAPSGYSHASLNATRSSPITSFSMRCVIARPQTSRRCSAICSLPLSTLGELGVV